MSKQATKQGAKQKKSTVLVTLVLLTALAFVLSTGAVSLARFVAEHDRDGTAVAAPFYFVSDTLSEDCPYTQLALPQGETVEFSVTLYNHVDSLRCSDREIQYDYTLTASDGTVLDENKNGKLPGGKEENQTLQFTVNRSVLEAGAVTLRVVSTAPYETELSGQFGLEERDDSGAAMLVREENGAVVLELMEPAGTVTVSWSSTLVPDPGCAYFAEVALTATQATITTDGAERLALTFLKTDPNLTYTESDFTVN